MQVVKLWSWEQASSGIVHASQQNIGVYISSTPTKTTTNRYRTHPGTAIP